jgi:hypothetical protein
MLFQIESQEQCKAEEAEAAADGFIGGMQVLSKWVSI